MPESLKPKIPLEFRESKAVTLGVFDGVHTGHRQILKRLNELDPDNGLVITFKTHPDEVIFGRQVKWLSSRQERVALLKEAGVAHVLEWPFDQALMSISAEEFVTTYFLEQLNKPHLVVGYDLSFGQHAKGNYQFLKENYSDQLKLSLIEAEHFEREIISSSRIRELVLIGDFKRVEKMLGRSFSSSGCVVKGDQRGRKLGFPTANVKPHKDIVLPPFGVYAVTVKCAGHVKKAVVNLGLRPTFVDDDSPLLEAHILDFEQDIYDEQIEIIWERFIRGEKKFKSQDELITQITKDIEEAQRVTN